MNEILQLSSLTTSRATLASIQNKFALYNMGLKYDFTDISKLIELYTGADATFSEIMIKLFEEVYAHWFTGICLANRCITPLPKKKDTHSFAYERVCSKNCQLKYDSDEQGKKNA